MMDTVGDPEASPLSGKNEGPEEEGFFNRPRAGGKSIWDWLDLISKLTIPIVVVGATIAFSWWQGQLADSQHRQDQQSAKFQHQLDQQSALDQQQATTLQTYIANMQDLLLNHNLLGDSPPPKNDADKATIKEVQELARARTLTALQGLDPHRKGVLLKFLFEANLIGYFDSSTQKIHPPIIILSSADLTQTDLTSADLAHTSFTDANLTGALLDGANLTGAFLDGAFLDGATLTHADLASADLTTHTNLTSANLSYANLTGALLDGANLTGANLTGATLNGTTLSGANLQGSNVTQQQLNQVVSCKRAILPAGLTCHHNQ
jgi:uncharacterized protein YjbI with pentapeptide repeats